MITRRVGPLARAMLGIVAVGIVALGALRGASAVGFLVQRLRAAHFYARNEFPAADTVFMGLVADAVRGIHSEALPSLDYNGGNVAYRRGRFEAAVNRFQGGLAGDRRLQEWTHYNLGNSYVWQARSAYNREDKTALLRAAVEAFEDALVVDPHDPDAKWNLEIALRRLAEAEEQATGRGPRTEANWGGGNLTISGYQGAPQTGAGATPGGGYGKGGGDEAVPEITQTQARRLVKAVERAQLMGQENQPPAQRRPAAPRHDRDW
jgi:tetratricopeptide (TPR) repeat protein